MIPQDLKRQLEKEASHNHRALSHEIIARLQASLDPGSSDLDRLAQQVADLDLKVTFLSDAYRSLREVFLDSHPEYRPDRERTRS